MENPSPPQSLSMNSSETVLSFPPHRRRPLRSRTYHALIGILSHCRTTCPQLYPQVDSGDVRLRPPIEENGPCTHNEANPADVSVPLPNGKESEDTLFQETSIGEDKNSIGFQDGGSDGKLASVPRSDPVNLVKGGEQEEVTANRISVGNLKMVENQTGDCAIQIAKEQESVNSVLDMQMDEFDTLEELSVDEEFSISEFSEALNSCFGVDAVVESSIAGEDSQENGNVLEDNILKEAKHELQLKEMELEKLLHNSGALESPYCLNADEEIEEGEIPEDARAADTVFEDDVSLGEKTTEMMHASEDSCDKEKVTCNKEDKGQLRHEMSDPSLVNLVNIDCNGMTAESRTAARQMQDYHSQNVYHDNHMEAQRSGPIAPCLESLTPNGRILQDNGADSQTPAAAEKDDNAKKKKRSLTEQRRAKKKEKKKRKRAEENRKLGVKRLKMQLILKPKTVSPCRHYLQGRCHEGEKCNFSHDAVPLTKSKPCCHFARHSCMKGDDCPFDHQLSNYPCKNYTSNGFCSRGSNCLFSHEMPAKQSFSMTPNVSKPELMSAQHTVTVKGGSSTISKDSKPVVKFQLNNSNSSKQTDNSGVFHQKVDAKFCSAGKSPGMGAELVDAKPVLRTTGQSPKGVSFLSNGGMSLGDTSKHKQDTPMKNSDGVDDGCKTILKMPGSVNKLSNTSDGEAPRKPRGINFLSFAQPSSDGSASEMFPNLLSSSKKETRKSVMDDMGKGKVICSLPQNQSATNLVPVLNDKVNGTPLTVPQHLNFLNFDKTSYYDSILKEGGRSPFNKGETALSFVKDRQSIQSELQDPSKMPSISFDGLRCQSTGGRNANLSGSFKTSFLSNTPSSVQKAVQSTLAFAAKFESDIKVGSSLHQQRS